MKYDFNLKCIWGVILILDICFEGSDIHLHWRNRTSLLTLVSCFQTYSIYFLASSILRHHYRYTIIHRYKGIQVYRYTGIQVYRYTGYILQVYRVSKKNRDYRCFGQIFLKFWFVRILGIKIKKCDQKNWMRYYKKSAKISKSKSAVKVIK